MSSLAKIEVTSPEIVYKAPPLKVICIDDEQNILQALKRVLRNEDFEVFTTNSADELLEQISSQAFAIIITDQRMPEVEGTKLLDIVKQVSPDTIRILLTGYTDIQAATEAINRGSVYRFLTKPWDDEMLKLTLQQAIKDYKNSRTHRQFGEKIKQKNSDLTGVNKALEKQLSEKITEIERLNSQLDGAFIQAVKTMAFITREHNTIIAAHAKRMSFLATQIAIHLNLPVQLINQIEFATLLHDIGESNLPLDIIQKPDYKRVALEKTIFEKHVIYGQTILQTMPNMEEIGLIVRSHHEQFNGKGYPDRLKGEEIPIGSRIIAVVDAYDQYINGGYTQQKRTPREAVALIVSKSGTEFDPTIIQALENLVEQECHLAEMKSNEVEIQLKNLQIGLVLSRDLITQKGILLLPKDSAIEAIDMTQIVTFLRNDPPLGGIFVYRDSLK